MGSHSHTPWREPPLQEAVFEVIGPVGSISCLWYRRAQPADTTNVNPASCKSEMLLDKSSSHYYIEISPRMLNNVLINETGTWVGPEFSHRFGRNSVIGYYLPNPIEQVVFACGSLASYCSPCLSVMEAIMSDRQTKLLLDDLKQSDASVRDVATQTLWQQWFKQKGEWGLTLLQQSQLALDAGELDRAEVILSDVLRSQPDFAEAWNRRAVLYYLQRRYSSAIADCQHVLDIVPFHFGALHGLGLCYTALKDYRAAIYAFRRALEIQPYAVVNQKLMLECTMQLESSDRP